MLKTYHEYSKPFSIWEANRLHWAFTLLKNLTRGLPRVNLSSVVVCARDFNDSSSQARTVFSVGN
jgi:hypothetical protein